MFYLYIDESGQEQKIDWMVVAGFFGDQKQWNNYSVPWADAIKPRRHLHMARLRFKRQSERLMLQKAGNVPALCELTPAFGVAKYLDYEDLVAGTEDERLFPGFMACCSPVVIKALLAIPKDERMEIVFEQQDRYERIIGLLMNYIQISGPPELRTTDGRPKLAKWSMVPKGSTTLIEASDYFSYALLQDHRKTDLIRMEWCRPILNTNSGKGYGKIYQRDELRTFVKEIQRRTRLGELRAKSGDGTK
jgi:hypothetical protein